MENKKTCPLCNFKLLGMRPLLYLVVLAVTLAAVYLKVLPKNMVGAMLVLLVVGELLHTIGDKTPIINTFFGGGPIVAIIVGSALVYYGVFPAETAETVSTFMKKNGFLDFYIAALITGSILGMNRKLLIRAAVRYLPCIVGGVVAALGLVALFGPLVGFNPTEAIAYIGIPIMGGGMGAGAVPISKVFATVLPGGEEAILGKLVPAVALGNALAIVAGGLLNRLGKKSKKLSGEGQLVRTNDPELMYKEREIKDHKINDYATGIALATGFFTLGSIISWAFKQIGVDIHTYAWMIISVAIVKALNLLPQKYEDACSVYFKFIAKNFTAPLLLGIGMAYTNLGQIISAFSIQYVVLVIVVVLGAILGSALVGYLVGFYPIEAAITAGLCMANMGGTGDVAVLTAADRMELMPFAQISSRIGGAFIILLASVLVPLFFK